MVVCLQSSEFRGQVKNVNKSYFSVFITDYFCLSNVRIPVTFFLTTVVLIVSLSPSTIRTVRISPGEPPFVTMTKWPSSMNSSDSTSSSRKSEIFVKACFLEFLTFMFCDFRDAKFFFLAHHFCDKVNMECIIIWE